MLTIDLLYLAISFINQRHLVQAVSMFSIPNAHVRFQSSHEPRMVVNKSKIQININEDAMSSACRCLTLSKDFEVPVCARGQAHP